MRIFCLLLSIVVIFACRDQKRDSILSTDALQTQTIKINTTRDTVVTTTKGALLKIEKGSFSGSETEVELQLKEAYSFEDIVRAGLTTRSNGKPLSSDGMIYINATDDDITIVKPINVSLPTSDYDVEMKLYKGEEKEGEINWVEPQPLADTMSTYLQSGKNLFEQNCASCHAYDKPITGPAMKGLEGRGPWSDRNELLKFTINPAAYAAHNCYVKNLVSEYGTIMPSYLVFGERSVDTSDGSDIDIDGLNAIYDYIKNEDIKRGIDLTAKQISSCEDSCRRYDSVRNDVEEKISSLTQTRLELIDSNDLRINYERLDSNGTGPMPNTRDIGGYIPKVQPEEYQGIYYSFDITSFGWHNIDKLQEIAKDDETSLVLSVDESLSKEIDVFIAVPQYNVFERGGKLSDGVHYGFFTLNSKLPLPVGVKVVVFALSEADGKIIYDYKEFISTSANDIKLTPRLATKEEFNEAVKRFSLERMPIVAKDSKNAEEIGKADKEIKTQKDYLELMRPKNCDCNCGPVTTNITTKSILIKSFPFLK